jgi:mercuric ion transport protein
MPMPESERSVVGAGTLATAGILASAGLVASHCLGAIAFVVFGSTLGALGALHALEPYRPWFMAAGFGFWGYGFYRLYVRAAGTPHLSPASACASLGRARTLLWVSLCVLLFAIALPTVAAHLAG